MLKTKDLNKDW